MKIDKRKHAEQEIIKHFLEIVKIAREYNPDDGYFSIRMTYGKYIHFNNSPDNAPDCQLDGGATISFHERTVVDHIDVDIDE